MQQESVILYDYSYIKIMDNSIMDNSMVIGEDTADCGN